MRICHPTDHHHNQTAFDTKGPVVHSGRAFLRTEATTTNKQPNRKKIPIMAVKLVSNYAKRLGLPGYSSHQFSVSVETELSDLERAPAEIAKLYQTLQQAVDREIQYTGFVPDDDYGAKLPSASQTHSSQLPTVVVSSDPDQINQQSGGSDGAWACSLKQRQLITDLAAELNLSDAELVERAKSFSGLPLEQMNKLAASNLISRLLEEATNQRNGNRQRAAA